MNSTEIFEEAELLISGESVHDGEWSRNGGETHYVVDFDTVMESRHDRGSSYC